MSRVWVDRGKARWPEQCFQILSIGHHGILEAVTDGQMLKRSDGPALLLRNQGCKTRPDCQSEERKLFNEQSSER